MKEHYWVYMLFCENNCYYTGYTNNLIKRYRAHVEGKGGKYTRSFKPVEMKQCWFIPGDKSLAMKMEYCIKNLSRKQKEELVQKPELLLTLL